MRNRLKYIILVVVVLYSSIISLLNFIDTFIICSFIFISVLHNINSKVIWIKVLESWQRGKKNYKDYTKQHAMY